MNGVRIFQSLILVMENRDILASKSQHLFLRELRVAVVWNSRIT